MARVAIVTGGTRGIGEAISLALRDAGMTVAATYAGNRERADAFTERTGIKAYQWDVADFDECQEGCARVADELGLGLGALVLLAGDVGQDGGDLAVTLLVCDHLCLAIGAGVGDAAVAVAKGQADGGAAGRLGGCLGGAHCGGCV